MPKSWEIYLKRFFITVFHVTSSQTFLYLAALSLSHQSCTLMHAHVFLVSFYNYKLLIIRSLLECCPMSQVCKVHTCSINVMMFIKAKFLFNQTSGHVYQKIRVFAPVCNSYLTYVASEVMACSLLSGVSAHVALDFLSRWIDSLTSFSCVFTTL